MNVELPIFEFYSIWSRKKIEKESKKQLKEKTTFHKAVI